MQLAVALEKYLVQLAADGRSAHTVAQYRRHVRLLAQWLGCEGHTGEIEAIGHETVASFLSSLVARTRPDGTPTKATTMNTLRSTVRTFFGYAHRAGYVAVDPARLVRRALCEAPPPRALSQRDQNSLLKTLARAKGPEARRDHALFHLMLSTGIRLGSALAIDVVDIDLGSSEVRLRSFKRGREERLLLGKTIRAHLRRFIAGRASGPLFAGQGGARLSSRHVQRRLGQWLGKADIDTRISPHALRHAFAARLYARTRDIHVVQQALHHRSIASTLCYARLDRTRLRRALAD